MTEALRRRDLPPMPAADRERLARAFDIQPVRATPMFIAGGFIAPVCWPLAGLVGASWLVVRAIEDAQIASGLREVQAWGWPVTGYRRWLLAAHPAFDIALRHEVGSELIAQAAAAVDAGIAVERSGARTLRFQLACVVASPSQEVQPMPIGDRRLLRELVAHVLAPLHADVGITQMRMGDRDALPATTNATGAGEVAFREQGLSAPPDLQSLVRAGAASDRPPDDAARLRLRTDRLLYAAGRKPASAARLGGWVGAGAVVGMFGGPLGALVGTTIGSALALATRQLDRWAVDGVIRELAAHPFRFVGYDNWLLSGRPIMDIELDVAIPDRRSIELRIEQAAGVRELLWVSDHVLRLETRPTHHLAGQGIPEFWGGDIHDLRILVREVLMPLHDAYGIVIVRMGGYLDRRA